MGRHGFRVGVVGCEATGCPQVAAVAFGRAHVRDDCLGDQRVGEAQRPAGREQLGRDERVGGF
jgi:hypothetical protein